MKKFTLLFLLAFLGMGFLMAENQEARVLRFPAIHGNHVVFTYAGDLYLVPLEGGIARRLTSDEKGYEMFARFSPDGKKLAFTGQYDGNTEVYVMPADGGSPKRITNTATLGRDDISDRMGPNNIVMTWKDNDNIIYRSRKKSFNSFIGNLFEVNDKGGMSKELPLATGSWISFSPDKQKAAFNQVFREFRTWKYYKGGMADDIWIFDFNTKKLTNITKNDAQDIFPMWHGDKIYFLSDRDHTMNLFVYDINTQTTRKLTHYTNYDIKFPSLGDKAIVYSNGGYLYAFDLNTEKIHKIPVYINNDLITARSSYKDASKNINSWAVSPHGERIALGARGDIWTVPHKTGITRNLTQTSGVHERNVEWSPKGDYVSYISDKTGMDEIYIQNQNGKEAAQQITSNGDTYLYNPVWSPDGSKLMWSDKMGRLLFVNVNTKAVDTVVRHSPEWEIRDYVWSPDSRWIAYTLPSNYSVNRIYVYNLDTRVTKPVTDTWFEARSPSFDNNGKYLFFISSRTFRPTYSWVEWNYAYQDMEKVYFVPLQKSTASPFAPENNEVQQKKQPVADHAKKSKKKSKKTTASVKDHRVKIDFDGITERVIELPVAPGRYWGVAAVGDHVYYNYFSSKSRRAALKMYNLKSQKEMTLGNVNGFIISADHKKMMVNQHGQYAVINLPMGPVKISGFADLSNMKVKVNLTKEWEQIYQEAWRQMKEFFYAPNMNGLDWNAIGKKYGQEVPFVKNRNDLNYLIGEMIAELSDGHCYVNGGDKPKPNRIKTGLLGAKISATPSGYFKIDHILPGEGWTKNVRSPLHAVGVNVHEGDYILAVDGKSTKDVKDFYALLVGKAGKQVSLKVNGQPDEKGAHNELVIPIADESSLYYYQWVSNNIKKVNEATHGEVGYIHIPDMGPGGLNEFVKYFYPQLNKKALIIDDRGNGGGNVSPMIIERLMRKLTLYGMSRNNGITTKPAEIMTGPKVLLVNQYSASDGDLFAYQFKKLKLGTVIGKRTWGGVVGIRGSLPFIDGGDLRKPEFAPYSTDGKWVIEGHGVEPNIVVENNPYKEYMGDDQQLTKAIEVIKKQLKDYKPAPPIPPYPVQQQ